MPALDTKIRLSRTAPARLGLFRARWPRTARNFLRCAGCFMSCGGTVLGKLAVRSRAALHPETRGSGAVLVPEPDSLRQRQVQMALPTLLLRSSCPGPVNQGQARCAPVDCQQRTSSQQYSLSVMANHRHKCTRQVASERRVRADT